MVTFTIHHGVKLPSTGKNLVPFQRYSTDKEEEIAELRQFQKDFQLCTEEVTEKPKKAKKEETVVTNDEDLSLMKGIVGKATAEKLLELDIATQTQLKAALADAGKKAAVSEAVGEATVTKMDAFFEAKDKEAK